MTSLRNFLSASLGGEPSSYANVFFEEPRNPWLKLKNTSLSIFHAKYWGKDICEERREWLGTQTRGHQMDIDENQMDTDEENQMGTDETPAGFALSFDSQAFNQRRMWVREDYELLYNDCTSYFNDSKVLSASKPPSIVITGQPGVGKSYWIYYAARRRLGEKKPFVWYFGLTWYLFVEDGVFECLGKFSPIPFRRVGLWALVDADSTTSGVPPEVAQPDSKLHTIFTTSPLEDRWKPLTKTTLCLIVIMNPWSWKEMYQAAIVHKFTSDEVNEARRIFDDLGPSARLCIECVQSPRMLWSYESRRLGALDSLSIDDLIQTVRDTRNFTFNGPDTLFLIRRVELNPGDKGYLQRYTVEPITSRVMQELKVKLMNARQEERLRVYETFERAPQLRQIAGLAFEAIGQRRLQKQITLTLVPMDRELPTTRGKIPQWKSQFVQDLEPMLTEGSGSVGTIPANGGTHSIDFQPHGIFQFPKPRPEKISSDIYYLPKSPNQVAFDSFIVNNGALYIFQFTIAASHPIKASIMDFFKDRSLESILRDKEWYFIFVIPPGGELVCSESSAEKMEWFWKNVKLFTAEMDPTNEG